MKCPGGCLSDATHPQAGQDSTPLERPLTCTEVAVQKPVRALVTRRYEVALELTEHKKAVVVLEASSADEAADLANAMSVDDIPQWEFVYDDMTLVSVEPVEQGGRHE